MKRVALVLVVAIGGFAAWWFVHAHGAKSPVTTPTPAVDQPAQNIIAPAQITRAEVAVSDAKGPLSGAIVRFVSDDDTIIVEKTNADGIAHSDLAVGTWTISAAAPGHLPKATEPKKLAAGETATLSLVLAIGGRPLTGQITDASGGPVAGARVDAVVLGAHAHAGSAVAAAFSAADGSYKLTVGDGEATVSVIHPDYAPQQRYVEIGETGAVANFQLVPGGVIEGVVRDQSTHATVGGARVTAARDRSTLLGEMGTHDVTCDSDGKFRITGLRPGAYALEARTEDRYSPTPTSVGLGVAEQVGDVVLLVGKGATIRGLVVDDKDQPVADIMVNDDSSRAPGVKSDAKGAFQISGAGPGSHGLHAQGGDYLPASFPTISVGQKDVDGVKVKVTRGEHFKGHVEPREACDVELQGEAHRGEPQFQTTTRTKDDGSFELGPAHATPSALVIARCDNGDEGSAKLAPEIVISVKPGGSIHGRVVDGKGKPIGGVSINAGSGQHTEITNGMVTSGASAITSATGEFDVSGLAAGDYALSVLDRGRLLPMKTKPKLSLAAGEHKVGVELVVERPDGVIQGTVTGPDGQPLVDAWVSVDVSFEDMIQSMIEQQGEGTHDMSISASSDGSDGNAIPPVLTDAKGHFIIENLQRIPWTVTAEAQAGKLRGRATKVTPDATIEIAIQSLRTLSGTVHATKPPEWFGVTLEGPTNARREFAWTDGTFSFGRVDPGDYTVTVTSSEGTAEAKVTVGNDNAHVGLTLTTGATITGILVDEAGKPLAGLPVIVVPDTGDGKMQIKIEGTPNTSGDDGVFHAPAKPGKSTLVVLGPGGTTTKPGLVITEGATLDVGKVSVK
jgi:Carboxypeptidase regulatory-like domain